MFRQFFKDKHQIVDKKKTRSIAIIENDHLIVLIDDIGQIDKMSVYKY
jgi:hypothetical protein